MTKKREYTEETENLISQLIEAGVSPTQYTEYCNSVKLAEKSYPFSEGTKIYIVNAGSQLLHT